MRTFFRLLRLGLRPSHAIVLAALWGLLIRFWWLWVTLVVVVWLIFQSGK
jgi:hypothetical protein